MKSIQLTERQISEIVNYLLGTELSVNAALQACYIDAEEPGYFANELDSASQYYLEERIFKCVVCHQWSKMFDRARATLARGEEPICTTCLMSPTDILYSDITFLRACGIANDMLRTGKPMGFAAMLFNYLPESERPNCTLQVTDADLDFLSSCGIHVRMTPKDAARRKLVTDERKELQKNS